MKREIVKGIVLFLAGITLLSVCSAEVYPVRFEESLGARRVKDADFSISASIQRDLLDFGYDLEQSMALTRDLLITFPSLQELRNISNQEDRIHVLAMLIRDTISNSFKKPKNLPSNLADALSSGEADCWSFAQIFYLLGRAVGLDAKVIEVCAYDHFANIAYLDDSNCMLVDLRTWQGEDYRYFIFQLGIDYLQEGHIWHQKESSNLSSIYKVMQILDNQGLASMVIFDYAMTLVHRKQYKTAMQYLKMAEDISPTLALIAKHIGTTFYYLGEYEEAEKYYRKAISLNPLDSKSYSGLSVVLIALGRNEEADEILTKEVAMESDY